MCGTICCRILRASKFSYWTRKGLELELTCSWINALLLFQQPKKLVIRAILITTLVYINQNASTGGESLKSCENRLETGLLISNSGAVERNYRQHWGDVCAIFFGNQKFFLKNLGWGVKPFRMLQFCSSIWSNDLESGFFFFCSPCLNVVVLSRCRL